MAKKQDNKFKFSELKTWAKEIKELKEKERDEQYVPTRKRFLTSMKSALLIMQKKGYSASEIADFLNGKQSQFKILEGEIIELFKPKIRAKKGYKNVAKESAETVVKPEKNAPEFPDMIIPGEFTPRPDRKKV